MTRIVYKSLSSLTPIELNYNFNTRENLKRDYSLFQNGLKINTLHSTENYQDVTINKYSCFILTDGVLADTVFEPVLKQPIGQAPGSVILQSRGSQIYYVKHNAEKNTLQATLTAPSMIYIQPVPNTNTAELIIENKYLQVDKAYPYTVRLNEKSLDSTEIHRQRFNVLQQNDIITFKTQTQAGARYLALNNDNIVRATGLVLNESIINDYVFHCIPVTTLGLSAGFIPTNNWVSYYYDIEDKTNNKNLEVKVQTNDAYTNYLIDFPYEEINSSGLTNINIANLKTNLTPTGAPGSQAPALPTPPLITTEERELQFEIEYEGTLLRGYLYIPTSTQSVDVILGFHGTTLDDDNSLDAAQTVLNQLKNNVGITDKAIVSVAYPQENMLFGDNIQYAEKALKWLMSNPTDIFEVDIDQIFLFGHSQGGYLVTRLNTMYKTSGVIASAPGPINLVTRCSAEVNNPTAFPASRECQLLTSTYGSVINNPQPYYQRSLINFTTGHKSNVLYVQGLADTAFQIARFNEFEAALNECSDCAPYLILKIPGGGHAAATGTEEGRQAVRQFLNGTLVFPNTNVTLPVIYAEGNFLSFTAVQNNFSSTQTFIVSGENLIQPISITAPIGYHISTNNAIFTDSLTLPFNAPNKVDSTTIYIRLKNNLLPGTYNGTIQIISGSTPAALVVNGFVTTATPQLNVLSNFTAFNATQGFPSEAQTFTVGGINLQNNITVTSPTNFEISENGVSYTSTITLVRSLQNTVTNTTLYIRLKSNLSIGTYSGNINIGTTDLGQPTIFTAIPVTGGVTAVAPPTPPALNVIGTLLPFNATQGSFSDSQTITVNGSNLQGNINIIASNEFEISQNNTTFSSTLTLANINGTLTNTIIYIRLKNNITSGTYSGNITLSTTNYTPNIVIAVTGIVTAIVVTPLIDKSSFINKFNPNLSRDVKMLNALNAAADAWNEFLYINPDVVTLIRSQVTGFSQFKGIRMDDPVIWSSNEWWIAACGPRAFRRYNNKFVTLTFQLYINEDLVDSESDETWKRVMIHELGHALGIGTFWSYGFSGNTVPDSNNFLDGTTMYFNTQQIYNQYTGLNRTKLPLESSGPDSGITSQNSHWEDNYRSSSQSGDGLEYYGILNDSLVAGISFYTGLPKITRLSITALTDMCQYLEKTPGAAEGELIVNTGSGENVFTATTGETSIKDVQCLPCGCGTCSNKAGSINFINNTLSEQDVELTLPLDSNNELNNNNSSSPV